MWCGAVELSKVVFCHVDFEICFAPQRRALFRPQKVARDRLTSRCVSRHKAVHFFHSSTSKSGPFYHFDFQMCFAPERRALFPHLNFQNCHRKNTASRLFFLFANLPLLSFDPFSSLIFSLLLFSSLLLSSLLWSSSLLLFSSLLFSSPLLSSRLVSSLLFSNSSHLCFFHRSILSEVWLLNFLWPILTLDQPLFTKEPSDHQP